MFNHLAALGVGVITALSVSQASAHDGREPLPRGSYPSYGAPAPTYAPAPPRVQPHYPRSTVGSHALVLSRADYNQDGGVTLGEAQAYGRAEFARADLDRNGVLTRRELRSPAGELAQAARRRDGVVTFAEYDANLQRQFYNLDHDRDAFLTSYELGTTAPPRPATVSWSWNWSL
jgi:EF hand domain-containing protein